MNCPGTKKKQKGVCFNFYPKIQTKATNEWYLYNFSWQRVQEMVKKIYKIIQAKMFSSEPLPPSPTGVLDAAIQGSCKLQKIGNKNMNSIKH